uniref:NADH-ubiquinone oxidoreductase chain 5 n=1 Tax=Medakamo hakoo TaxID=3113649 RepID=A0A8D5Q5L1_9CHLO|nr:NADH dehydrogenase subunit 5 [Medakamo hakoo]
MYLLLVFLPLLGSCVAGLFGFLIGSRGAVLVTTGSVFVSAFLSGVVFYEVALCGSSCTVSLSPWFISEFFDAGWGFYFDTLTSVMLVVITWVSTLVHLYSVSYMEHDPHLPRFMSYLSLFTFCMLMLVTADNFLQLFFGWEGVGLASYLLINFWFTRLQASKASIKAMLMNRVGDIGLALGIMALYTQCQTVNFACAFACAPRLADTSFTFCTMEVDALTTICILLFIGSIGKSAQLGLHTWLPDAMEGPTPVSALIHAATMVTAGVFLVARCSPLFEYAPGALVVVAVIGAMTCFFAATTGLVQNDLKRVIAYSTCSQLGYMVFACGLSQYSVGVFHLMNHAFFKALLFLSAGSVIHGLSDEQDMRRMGGIVRLFPFTYSMMLIGSLALVGFPYLTGFYSKDRILELAYATYTISGNFAYWFGTICVFLTSLYSFRLLFMTFLAPTTSSPRVLEHAHDAPPIMAIPLVLLAFGSIFVGYLFHDMFIGLGTNFWGNAVFILPKNTLLLESEYIPQAQKMIPLIFTLAGAFVAYAATFYWSRAIYAFKMTSFGRSLYTMASRRWFFDQVYNQFFAQKALDFGYHISWKTLDKGWFEVLGPYGIIHTFPKWSRRLGTLQSGLIPHYAVLMVLGLTLAITCIALWDVLEGFVDPRLYFLFFVTFLFTLNASSTDLSSSGESTTASIV